LDDYGWYGDDEEEEENPFVGVDGYEPLGDIYNEQRLGSFEAEPGLGGFVPETANPRDQQVADKMKAKAGVFGDYESFQDYDDWADYGYGESVGATIDPFEDED
jgi:hypothetical protein